MIRVHASDASLAWALCAAQAITTAAAALVTWVVADGAAALAALYGGVVVMLPTAYFAVRVYLRGGAHAAEILAGFYRAEFGKLLLTALLFFFGASLFGKHFAPLIFTSMACLAMNWLMLAIAND
ncbi:MAG: ATP synthase subunit I [Rudaea sp.]